MKNSYNQGNPTTVGMIPKALSKERHFLYQVLSWIGFYFMPIMAIFFVILSTFSVFAINNSHNVVRVDPDNIFVSDNAFLLKDETKKEIYDFNQAYKKLPNQPQFMVITVDNVPYNQTIEEFTYKKANELGVGSAKYNSGVVYLLAKNQRKSRLEVGSGMLQIVPPSKINDIVDETVKNAYRKGDYNRGIFLVAKRINQLIIDGKITDITHKETEKTPVEDAHVSKNPFLVTWVFLNSPQKFYVSIGLLVLFGIVWYLFFRMGFYFKAHLHYDVLVNHYLEANDNQGFKGTSKGHLEKNDGIKPDYYDMDFAFGKTTKGQFMKEDGAPSKDYKQTSMYQNHQIDWYKKRTRRKISSNSTFKHFKKTPIYEKMPVHSIKGALLSPIQQVIYSLVDVLLSPLLWFALIVLSFIATRYLNIIPSYELRFQLARIFYKFNLMRLLDNIIDVVAFLFRPHQSPFSVVFSISIIVIVIILLIVWGSTRTKIKQRLRLNSMANAYVKDLNQEFPTSMGLENLKKILIANEPNDAVENARDQLAIKLDGNTSNNQKNKHPDYYDMAFAFGRVTNKQFLQMDPDSSNYKDTSMYINHTHDWYRSGSDNDGDSGGSDSFGGGSFGGSGGTSSW